MTQEEVELWTNANNIIPEYVELFRDFSFSFYFLVRDTYLGHNNDNYSDTKIGLTHEDKLSHFNWCWKTTAERFKKENISFNFIEKDVDYFRSFYFEIFYDQPDTEVRDALGDFLTQLFDRSRDVSMADIEMFTDVYKLFERSLQKT